MRSAPCVTTFVHSRWTCIQNVPVRDHSPNHITYYVSRLQLSKSWQVFFPRSGRPRGPANSGQTRLNDCRGARNFNCGCESFPPTALAGKKGGMQVPTSPSARVLFLPFDEKKGHGNTDRNGCFRLGFGGNVDIFQREISYENNEGMPKDV